MSILYCGDTDLSGAASYLAGLMTLWGWDYDYVPSHVPLSNEHVGKPRKLFVFSDYPSTQVDETLQQSIIEQVHAGAGLLMIGGWESFHGLGGDWDVSEIAHILPVEISRSDDRVNSYHPAMLSPAKDHPILAALPWDSCVFVGGWNRVRHKEANAEAVEGLLTIRTFRSWQLSDDEELLASGLEDLPGLVVRTCDQGRTAAFMSDVAPHWVGGFVDWGDARVTAQASGAPAIEVGNWYAQFWRQLLSWTGRLS